MVCVPSRQHHRRVHLGCYRVVFPPRLCYQPIGGEGWLSKSSKRRESPAYFGWPEGSLYLEKGTHLDPSGQIVARAIPGAQSTSPGGGAQRKRIAPTRPHRCQPFPLEFRGYSEPRGELAEIREAEDSPVLSFPSRCSSPTSWWGESFCQRRLVGNEEEEEAIAVVVIVPPPPPPPD